MCERKNRAFDENADLWAKCTASEKKKQWKKMSFKIIHF